MTTPELLPCPFCGCTTIVPHHELKGVMVCDWCKTEGPVEGVFDDVPQGWNTRAPISPAVLADLPEVKAMVKAETERCAKIADEHTFGGAAVAASIRAVAAAIREGRNAT